MQAGKVDLSLFVHLRNRSCADAIEALALPQELSGFFLGTGECLFWMNCTCPLFEKAHIHAADLEGCASCTCCTTFRGSTPVPLPF